MRTAVTQLLYWPSLVTHLRHADVVHVFSASYYAFLLATWPAVQIARLLGKPVVMNYHSGEAPDHLARSGLARRTLTRVELNVVQSEFLQDVFAGFAIPARIIPNVLDVERFRFRARRPLRPRLVSTRNFEPMYNVACTLRAFRARSRPPSRRDVVARRRGSDESRLRALARSLRLEGVTFAGRVSPGEIWRCLRPVRHLRPDVEHRQHAHVRPRGVRSGLPVVATAAGGVPAILTDGAARAAHAAR